MKRAYGKLWLSILLVLFVTTFSQATPIYQPKIVKDVKTRCILFGVAGRTSDPAQIALLQRISDQQAQMLANQTAMQLLNQQPKTDPALTAILTKLSDQQDRVLEAINKGSLDDSTKELMRQMISRQDLILAALNNPKPSSPPIIVNPPPPVIHNPAGGGNGGLLSIPNNTAIQALPGPGGALNLIPPNGGTLQALPGPGGSIMVLPGGTKPPDGTKPAIGGAIPGVPNTGTVPDVPMGGLPIPGMPESKDPVSFKTTRIYKVR